jgi:uncharacterized protein YlxW (UPF0749 family)
VDLSHISVKEKFENMNKKVQALILGIMCLILTIGICVQVKTVNNNGTTISTNQTENELRDQILKMKEKYDNIYEQLQDAQTKLAETRENVTNNNSELKSLEEQIKKANTLLGLTDVTGQGVTITVTEPTAVANALQPEMLIVHNTDLLSIVNELKNAGAEAIEINGQRIVGTTAITCDGNVIMINGERVSSTFTINAIGFPELMATLTRTGGCLSLLEDYNIKTTFKKSEKISIPKYTGIINFKYAKSVS